MANSTHGNSLWKVLGLYGAGSWVVLQVIDVLAQNAGLPAWIFTLALILLIIGLPIVGATAYLNGIGRNGKDPEGATVGERGTPSAPRQFFTWKNALAGGVAAMALWGILVTGWLFFGPGASASGDGDVMATSSGGEAPVADLRSVAVLPFATRSADESDEYFSEGMHDDLLTQLSKIDSLTVISRTSVMQYASTTKSIPEIADELGVATILEGGIQRAGDRVRINVQLIEASTDKHLWAETYDEELTAANVFAIQSDLAKKIAGALQATLSPDVAARIDARPTENTEALELYSRARYLILSAAGASQEMQARDLLEQAVKLDPGYARAWAALGSLYLALKADGSIPVAEGTRKADEAITRALELEPDLASAHSARSLYLTDQLRYEEAEEESLRALELNPGSSEEHRRYARLLLQLDRHDESVQQARRAVELDPLSIQSRASLGDAMWWAGDWEGTVTESMKLIEMAPNNAYAHYNLGYGHAMQGHDTEAIEAFRKAVELDPGDPQSKTGLAWAWARVGQRDSALAALEGVPAEASLIKEIAIVYGELGDLDTAYDYLYMAVEEDPGSIGTLRTDHSADPLKADPRYPDLLARVGLEP
ncbi:MAG: tetratricopeptide repeat protein [marine benthic group bacterium]|nr:tetratricopeptide repeat protein [Gemmatimonadota bacterium]